MGLFFALSAAILALVLTGSGIRMALLVITAILGIATAFEWTAPLFLVITASALLPPLLALNLAPLRRRLLSAPVLRLIRKNPPPSHAPNARRWKPAMSGGRRN